MTWHSWIFLTIGHEVETDFPSNWFVWFLTSSAMTHQDFVGNRCLIGACIFIPPPVFMVAIAKKMCGNMNKMKQMCGDLYKINQKLILCRYYEIFKLSFVWYCSRMQDNNLGVQKFLCLYTIVFRAWNIFQSQY